MKKVGRNDPCPCDSGKKYKQCCMQQDDTRAAAARPVASANTSNNAQYLQIAFAQHRAGRLDEAERLYRQVLQTEPKHAEALHLMGVLAGDRGDYAAAIELIGQAIRINASSHSYHANLGQIYSNLNEPAKAEACYRLAVALKPDSSLYDNLGNALRAQNKFKEARDSYRRALELNPGYASAHRNMGDLLHIQGKYVDAITSYRQAIALQPDLAQAVANLGTTLQTQGKFAEAIDYFRKALAIEPNNPATHGNLLYALSIQDIPAHYLKEVSDYGLQLQAQASPYTSWSHAPLDSGQPLRVGLVSGDFREHPVSFFLENLLAHLNPAAVELIAYPTTAEEDTVSARIKPYFSAWRPIGNLNDRDAAQKIHADALHILIDLSGHTGNHRLPLFAWRPAPLQLSWLGYWASTGLAAIDYILVDPHSVPASEAAHFREKLWYLPHTRLCFTPPQEDIAIAPLPALNNRYVTFGCFNNPTKMGDAVVALWAKILVAVPESRLMLKAKQFSDEVMAQDTLERFARHGIEAARIILAGESPRAEYLTAYNSIDIALDPFPFTGGTTSIEGLWMGVPLITRRGDRLIARQGESILQNMDLADWIADDDASYIDLAVTRAKNLHELAELRKTLRDRLLASPLCDAPRFARDFEAALAGMWREYTEKNAPQNG